MEPRTIRLVLTYEGTHYRGWQRQKSGPTIQGTLEAVLLTILREPVTVIGSGRTDAGVHALGQVCHFKTRSRLSPAALRRGLNALLPEDIRVRTCDDAPTGFHARYSALSKLYEYRIWNRPDADPFLRRFSWHLTRPLDLQAMAACLRMLLGTRDFSAFRASKSKNRNPVRTLMDTRIETTPEGLISIRMEADGFLRHMVRNVVGTLAEVGRGRISPERFEAIIKGRDRTLAGPTAPAKGLFLLEVRYPPEDGLSDPEARTTR